MSAFQGNTTDPIDVLFESYKKSLSNLDSADYYLDKAMVLVDERKDSSKLAIGLDYRGWVFILRQDYENALLFFHKALPIAKKSSRDREGILYNHLAIAHLSLGKLDSALYYGFQCKEVREELGEPKKLAAAFHNIGIYYNKLGKTMDAIQYFDEAAVVYLLQEDTAKYIQSVSNLASAHLKDNNPALALKVGMDALKFCNRACNYSNRLNLNEKVGVAYYMLKEYDKAEVFLSLALTMMKDKEQRGYSSSTRRFLAKVYLEKGDVKKFLSYMDESINYSMNDNDLIQLKEAFYDLSRYFQSTGDFEKAYKYREDHLMLQDRLLGTEVMNNVEKIHLSDLRYRSEQMIQEAEAGIDKLDKENRLMKIIGGLFLVLVLGGWRSYKLIQNKNKTIAHQNLELHKYNDSLRKDMVSRTSELEETSKVLDNFIYRTSHDIRGPIASLKGLSHVAKLEVKDEKAIEYFDRIRDTAENMEYVLDGLREVNKVKYSVIIPEELDLKSILIRSVNARKQSDRRKDVGVTVDISEDAKLISDSELVFVAVDKIIDNAFKFHSKMAEAPNVFVKAYKFNGGVKLKISDNGIGIDKEHMDYIFDLFERASDQTQFGGIGLYVSRLALNRLGGAIRADRDEDKRHTIFEIYLPNLHS